MPLWSFFCSPIHGVNTTSQGLVLEYFIGFYVLSSLGDSNLRPPSRGITKRPQAFTNWVGPLETGQNIFIQLDAFKKSDDKRIRSTFNDKGNDFRWDGTTSPNQSLLSQEHNLSRPCRTSSSSFQPSGLFSILERKKEHKQRIQKLMNQ